MSGAAGTADECGSYHLDCSWRMDPVLELWVDVAGRPAVVRLQGLLDRQTGKNVLGVVEELLAEGHRRFELDVGGLEVPDGAGLATLVAVERSVRRAGGSVLWANWSALKVSWVPDGALTPRATDSSLSPATPRRSPRHGPPAARLGA